MKTILFISHDATLTGAPILLNNLLTAIRASSTDYQFRFLIKNAPLDLYERFRSAAPTFIASSQNPGIQLGLKLRVLPYRWFRFSEREIGKALDGVDIVISNTLTNGDLIPLLRKYFRGPILAYIHELKMAASFFTDKMEVERLISVTDYFLVPSEAVQRFLVEEYGIREGKILHLPYFIPPFDRQTNEAEASSRKGFVVGSAGTIDWRKAPDIFIQVAAAVFRREPKADIRFLWKGANKGMALDRLVHDVEKAALTDRVSFALSSDSMGAFYNNIDVLLLPSREDPYPLVVLEAADAGVPTICFRQAGGATEFVDRSTAGNSVHYGDIDAMADAILDYYRNPEQLQADGLKAKSFLSETHQNPAYIFEAFESVIAKVRTNV